MRRANGTGTVSKRKGNLRKPWLARVTVGWDNGKQVFKTVGWYATKADAEQALAADKLMPTDMSVTLEQLFEEWKKTRAYTDLSQQTQYNYDAAYNYMSKYKNKKFGALKLTDFQNMIDGAGKSRSTLAKIKTLIKLLNDFALAQDIIVKSYASLVRLPKAQKKTPEIFNDIEIDKLFKNDTLPLVDTILILIYTGMRIEELLSLTKFNVDIENMIITGGIKTDAGTDRIVPVHPKIQKYIRARYDSAENYLIEWDKPVGNKKQGTFRTEKDRYNYSYYRDLYYPILVQLGIRRLTPHKARHTFFTNMSAKCDDRLAMALIGGHSDPAFSEKVYTHPDVDRLRRAIEKM